MLFIGQFTPLSAGSWAKQAPLCRWFFKASWPALQSDQLVKDLRRYKLENGASGCFEDSSPPEGASSPPLSEADPHHSWSPGTESATRRQKTKERDRAGQTSGGIRKQPFKAEEEEAA